MVKMFKNEKEKVVSEINAAKDLFITFSWLYMAAGFGFFVCLFLKIHAIFYIPVMGVVFIITFFSMYNYNCVLTKHGTLNDVLKLIKGN